MAKFNWGTLGALFTSATMGAGVIGLEAAINNSDLPDVTMLGSRVATVLASGFAVITLADKTSSTSAGKIFKTLANLGAYAAALYFVAQNTRGIELNALNYL